MFYVYFQAMVAGILIVLGRQGGSSITWENLKDAFKYDLLFTKQVRSVECRTVLDYFIKLKTVKLITQRTIISDFS